MTQSRLESLMETIANIVIGYLINFFANMVVLPWFFGHGLPLGPSLVLGLVYTVIALARTYALRRWFNARLQAAITRAAARIAA